MYRNYVTVKKENIITFGVTGESFGKHRYIVYVRPKDINWKVHINADFYEDDCGNYICCLLYDRRLCRTIEEFGSITAEEIESQAYGAYMDGAR
ncbi:MAG: hypothetical protein K2I06_04995 [Ruminococcus sp.]|nr:hypothetical protein [Ruminococcus sp.]